MVRITGTTQLAGIVGWPVDHSLSPVMHNAAYEELGLDWAYIPLPVSDEIGLRRLVAAIRGLPFVGFNITMPYKADMLELCDEVATTASMAGAVNTVHCVDGRLIGYNTDGRGMLEALEEDAGFSPEGKRVVLLGAGGAAGAAFVAFVVARAARVDVVSRDVTRAQETIARVDGCLMATEANTVSFDGAEQVVRDADLIVNATPLGMRPDDPSPLPASWLRKEHVVLDMVYKAGPSTALLSDARAAGAAGFDGLGMLVCQGATAIDIWNGRGDSRTPRAIMRRAAENEIASRVFGGGE